MTSFGIVGMGKMGQSIVTVLEANPTLQFQSFNRITPDNQALLKACDVVIEFTNADASPGIISHCISSGIPIVSGTTGWQEYHFETIKNLCNQHHGRFLYASNFSIGMNIMFALNQKLATIMNSFPQFKPTITERHHIHKKDKPSGTAYTLIEGVVANHQTYSGFDLNDSTHDQTKIPVTAIREGEIKGYHEIVWSSPQEEIKLAHEAFDRKIFAEGAIIAAAWLKSQKAGVYTMRDIIHL